VGASLLVLFGTTQRQAHAVWTQGTHTALVRGDSSHTWDPAARGSVPQGQPPRDTFAPVGPARPLCQALCRRSGFEEPRWNMRPPSMLWA